MRHLILIVILFLFPDQIFGGEKEKSFIIQETDGPYWYCPIDRPDCFWFSAFHDRYNCWEWKRFHGRSCDFNDVPQEVEDPCKFPPNINAGFCARWRGYNSEDQ